MIQQAWKALAESFHSALIDEFNERLPNDKPELGLPSRCADWQMPACVFEIVFPDGANNTIKLFVIFAAAEGFEKNFGIGLEEFCGALIRRATPELARRGHVPVIGTPLRISIRPELKRLVWIPLRIRNVSCALAIGA
jgi:hypothetical protein